MSKICQDVNRLELRKFFKFCVACLQLLNEKKGRYLISDMHVQNKKFYMKITDKCLSSHLIRCNPATQQPKIKKKRYNFSLWTCSYILWTYQETKIKVWLLDDFWPDSVASTLIVGRIKIIEFTFKLNIFVCVTCISIIMHICEVSI